LRIAIGPAKCELAHRYRAVLHLKVVRILPLDRMVAWTAHDFTNLNLSKLPLPRFKVSITWFDFLASQP
jgi:hypothetical protein